MALPSILWEPSPNFNTPAQTKIYYKVPRTIEYIVIHHWDDPAKKPAFNGVVNHLTNPSTKVSAHYVVEADRITQLVQEGNTAWHAGGTANPRSIGIECNPRQSAEDYQTIAELIADIWKRIGIMPIYPHKKFVNTACPGTYDLGKLHAMAMVILVPPKPVPVPVVPPAPEPAPAAPEKPVETPPSEPPKPVEKPQGGDSVMEPKKFWQSKTLWTSLATILTGIGLYLEGEQELQELLISVIGVAFGILRLITSEPVEK